MNRKKNFPGSQKMKIKPARRVAGTIKLPGDKSISHRAAIIAALADGITTIQGFATSKDCQSPPGWRARLGMGIGPAADGLKIHGPGLHGWQAPTQVLDAGN